jgi:hypothetical protein
VEFRFYRGSLVKFKEVVFELLNLIIVELRFFGNNFFDDSHNFDRVLMNFLELISIISCHFLILLISKISELTKGLIFLFRFLNVLEINIEP